MECYRIWMTAANVTAMREAVPLPGVLVDIVLAYDIDEDPRKCLMWALARSITIRVECQWSGHWRISMYRARDEHTYQIWMSHSRDGVLSSSPTVVVDAVTLWDFVCGSIARDGMAAALWKFVYEHMYAGDVSAVITLLCWEVRTTYGGK